MLNTSVTHITELEEAIREAVYVLSIVNDPVAEQYGERLKHAAESFGLDLSDPYDEDDPFGTGDIV